MIIKFNFSILLLLYLLLFNLNIFNNNGVDASGAPIKDLVIPKDEELRFEEDAVTVLMWTGNGWASLGKELKTPNYNGETKEKPKCPVQCNVIEDKTKHSYVDAVLFEAQPLGSWGYEYYAKPPKFPMKEPGQSYISFSFEHHVYFPIQIEPEYLNYVDINMTLFKDANVRLSSTCSWGIMTNGSIDNFKDAPIKPFNKKLKHPVFFASNCHGGGAIYRTEYIKELQKHIPVDAYGSCLHNKDLEKADNEGGIFDDLGKTMNIKSRITGGYLFGLAFENNNFTNYVTEKVYSVLLSGSVPIYMGAPNIDEYVPRNSVIKTDSFKSPGELAKYLKYLSKNETAYNEYLAWKNEPYPQSMIELYEDCIFYTADCRMCKLVHAIRNQNKKKLGAGFRIDYGEPDIAKYNKKVATFDDKSCLTIVPPSKTDDKFKNLDSISVGSWIFITKKVDDILFDISSEIIIKLKNIWYREYLCVCILDECITGVVPIALNEWKHIGITYGERKLKIYINGLLDIDTEMVNKVMIKEINNIIFGCKSTFRGLLDDFIVWGKALEQKDMSRTMFAKIAGNEDKLLVYMTFNTGEAVDFSINKSNVIGNNTVIIVDADYQELRLNCCHSEIKDNNQK